MAQSLASTMCTFSASAKEEQVMNRTYYQYIEITDFGPYITKLILCLPCEVRAQDLRKEQFCVYTQILDMEGRQVELPENFLLRDRFVQSRGG